MMKGRGIIISIGKWGGVFVNRGQYIWRISLGWIAITFTSFDADQLIVWAEKWLEVESRAK